MSDTIVAIATPTGRGALSVIRISGADTQPIVSRIFKPRHRKRWKPEHRKATVGYIFHPESGELLDEVVVIFFVKPHSYTGEDLVEISCHGGVATSTAVMKAVLLAGAVPAGPGAFTKRAFLNGKIDLAQAESIAALSAAVTQNERRLALRNLGGNLSRKIQSVRESIETLLAHLEADLDFPEESLGISISDKIEKLKHIEEIISDIIEAGIQGNRVRSGFRVVLTGNVNAGKSKIFNRIIGRERAIVTDEPGTTRDSLEEYWLAADISISIVDTAGVRRTHSKAEQKAIEAALSHLEQADLVLFVMDATAPRFEYSEHDIDVMRRKTIYVIWNKIDIASSPEPHQLEKIRRVLGDVPVICVSAKTGKGFRELQSSIRSAAAAVSSGMEHDILMINTRQIASLEKAFHLISEARKALKASVPTECIVPEIKSAIESLGEITGHHTPPDVLDIIFTDFCIGK